MTQIDPTLAEPLQILLLLSPHNSFSPELRSCSGPSKRAIWPFSSSNKVVQELEMALFLGMCLHLLSDVPKLPYLLGQWLPVDARVSQMKEGLRVVVKHNV